MLPGEVQRRVSKARALLGAVAWMGLLVGAATGAVAQAQTQPQTQAQPQNKGTAQAPYLRLEWEFDSVRGNYQNACGRVFNDRDTAARHVIVVFDGFDAGGGKVSSRFGEVVGDVPPHGYAIFCLMVKAGAVSYQASIPRVDWGSAGQAP